MSALQIVIALLGCVACSHAFPYEPGQMDNGIGDINILDHYVPRPLFENKLQFDVVTVLLLLGEATIWKSIWTRFRFRRCHWKQWIFAIAPGWAPLAGSIFAAMQGSRGPPNLIYDRAPAEALYPHLELTNLNSGASHKALNVILQNVWQTWYNGPRKSGRKVLLHDKYYTSKEVGIVDVDVSKMESPTTWTLYLQFCCLVVQLGLALVLGLLGLGLEVFVTFLVTLAAQGLLLAAITPRHDAWDHRELTTHKVAPVMLHMGMDTTSILFVRSAARNGQTFSLEEYSWESQTVRSNWDVLQLLLAGVSFCGFALQLILISWMTRNSRFLFLILGALGLFTNAVEGAIEPDWNRAYRDAFSGEAFCEPDGSSLKSALGVLIGGKFAAGEAASKLLYPDNKRFEQTLADLRDMIEPDICDTCCARIRTKTDDKCMEPDGILCCRRLATKVQDPAVNNQKNAKSYRDAIASVAHFLRLGTEDEGQPRIDTNLQAPLEQWDWQKNQ